MSESETVVWRGGRVERRRRRDGSAVCPRCRCETPLWSETVAWRIEDDGRKTHAEYGPSEGFCCDLLFVDDWDGLRAYVVGDA